MFVGSISIFVRNLLDKMSKWRSNVKRWRNSGGLEEFGIGRNQTLESNHQTFEGWILLLHKPWKFNRIFQTLEPCFVFESLEWWGFVATLPVTPNSSPSSGFIAPCHDWICTRFRLNENDGWNGERPDTKWPPWFCWTFGTVVISGIFHDSCFSQNRYIVYSMETYMYELAASMVACPQSCRSGSTQPAGRFGERGLLACVFWLTNSDFNFWYPTDGKCTKILVGCKKCGILVRSCPAS